MRTKLITRLFAFAFILFLSAGVAYGVQTEQDNGEKVFSFDNVTAVSDTGDPKEHHDMKENKEQEMHHDMKEDKDQEMHHDMKEDKEHEMHHGEGVHDDATETAGEIWNKFCPVLGGEVDPETPTIEYDGKTIGFCCPGCDKKFNKDPEKYLKNLSEDGQEYVGEK